MLARLARERCVTIPVGMVRLSCNRHSPELFSFDCVDSCILLRIVPCFSNGRNAPDGVELRDYLNIVQSEAERLSALVEDLLSLARMDADELHLDVAPI